MQASQKIFPHQTALAKSFDTFELECHDESGASKPILLRSKHPFIVFISQDGYLVYVHSKIKLINLII